ncbi:MAG: GIY-YIG nuclease family protein [Pirellulales bacterium]
MIDDRQIVFQVFADTNGAFSVDRIIADPLLNSEFIQQCRARGASTAIVDLNLRLLNLRKAGLLKGLPRPVRTSFKNNESYRHASEIAVRYLEKRDSTTLDLIICDPVFALEFDRIAFDIAPGFSSLEYRWAALNLRKARSLRPELLSRVARPTSVALGSLDGLRVDDVPGQQGLYIFYGLTETLYVGEGSNLRKRIGKHLEHSDNKNLARWFWENGFNNVHLELQILCDGTTTKVRRALEAELISSRRNRSRVGHRWGWRKTEEQFPRWFTTSTKNNLAHMPKNSTACLPIHSRDNRTIKKHLVLQVFHPVNGYHLATQFLMCSGYASI